MMKQPRKSGTTRGFSRAATLMQSRIRSATESRGFAETRLLTHWPEIVGEAIAGVCRPVKVSYAQGGLGATLTLLTTGAQAPMLDMQKEALREKVNTCYGYNAISRILITQTSPVGFAEGAADFVHRKPTSDTAPPRRCDAAQNLAQGIENPDLRLALEALGTNVLTNRKSKKSERPE